MMKKIIPSIIVGILCAAIVAGILLFPIDKQTSGQLDLSEYSSVSAICELATLKSFYHNVAMYEKKPEGGEKFLNDVVFWPFGDFTKTGYKQYWMEYSGVVEAGIDAGQMQINNPDAKGVVEIYVPDAKVLNVSADEDSFSNPITEKGLFTTITTEEKTQAYATAQSTMRQEAENDQSLLSRARNNAKLLLKQYIVNTGKEMGIDYTVKWISTPL